MSLLAEKVLNLQFPHGEHADCRALTSLTLENIPKDGTLGQKQGYERNTIVWRPDDRSDRLYFVLRGRIQISAIDRDGRELLLRTVVAGEPFGELCFCGGPTKQRRTTAQAVVNSTIVEIDIEDFLSYVRRDVETLVRVIFTFCIRLADAEQRVEILALRGAEERLGNALLHLAQTRGVANQNSAQTIGLNVTHDELASLTALSRQRVTITMNRFRERNLVAYNRNQPLVINTLALAEFLGQMG